MSTTSLLVSPKCSQRPSSPTALGDLADEGDDVVVGGPLELRDALDVDPASRRRWRRPRRVARCPSAARARSTASSTRSIARSGPRRSTAPPICRQGVAGDHAEATARAGRGPPSGGTGSGQADVAAKLAPGEADRLGGHARRASAAAARSGPRPRPPAPARRPSPGRGRRCRGGRPVATPAQQHGGSVGRASAMPLMIRRRAAVAPGSQGPPARRRPSHPAIARQDATRRCRASRAASASPSRAAAASSGARGVRQAWQLRLRLRIAEPDVELQQARSVGGEHQARVQRAPEGDAPPRQLGQDRAGGSASTMSARTPVVDVVERRDRAHAAGVRAPVAVEQSLVVARGRQRQAAASRRRWR